MACEGHPSIPVNVSPTSVELKLKAETSSNNKWREKSQDVTESLGDRKRMKLGFAQVALKCLETKPSRMRE